ncbi:HD domain-containing protein [Trichothermofontia sp.]
MTQTPPPKIATLADAVAIAALAHRDQHDQAGAPYLLHPLRLLLRMDSETAMMAAVLHDVVEDTPWTLEQLRDAGFPEAVLDAVDCLTRRSSESYDAFIERISQNPIARQVKIADLEDNMNLQRLGQLTPKDLERLEKYHRAWCKLTNRDNHLARG